MSHIHCDGSPLSFRIFSFMALSANFCHLSCNTFHTAILMVIWCHYVPILLSLYLTWIVVALKRLFLAIFNVLMQKYFRIHLSEKRCEECHSIIIHTHIERVYWKSYHDTVSIFPWHNIPVVRFGLISQRQSLDNPLFPAIWNIIERAFCTDRYRVN